MADAKVSALAALTGANVDTAADVLMIVDTDATASKKITVDELRTAIGPQLDTEQATTSGTEKDFSVPAWATKVTLTVKGVSTNGTSNFLVQLGDAGGVENTGYSGAAGGSTGVSPANFSDGFLITAGGVAAAGTYSGVVTLVLEDASDFTWHCTGTMSRTDAATAYFFAGHKATSAAVTTVRFTTASGDTLDAGAVNATYE